MTDTSELAIRALLQQCIEGQWCSIAHFSKALKQSESRYSTYDRELLAIYLAIKNFRHFIEGHSFHVHTDHKHLTARSDRYSPWQTRHLDLISQYTSDILHVKGAHNLVADALSMVDIGTVAVGSDFTPVIDFGVKNCMCRRPTGT